MDKLQKQLTEAYEGMFKEASDWDYYYKEIMQTNWASHSTYMPILKKEIEQSALDPEGKAWMLQKLKAQADKFGIPY